MAGQKRDTRYAELLPAVGARLRAIRASIGLSQDQMVSLLGFSRRQWVSWEKGEVTPSVWALLELQLKLHIDPAWVIGGPGLIPVYRPIIDDRERFESILDDVLETSIDVGFNLTESAAQMLSLLIFQEPKEQQHQALWRARNLLRALSHGKDEIDDPWVSIIR